MGREGDRRHGSGCFYAQIIAGRFKRVWSKGLILWWIYFYAKSTPKLAQGNVHRKGFEWHTISRHILFDSASSINELFSSKVQQIPGCRGMQTCSIMLSGKMDHEDSCGNKVGHLSPLCHLQFDFT